MLPAPDETRRIRMMVKFAIRLILLALSIATASFALLSRASAAAEKHHRDQAEILEVLKNQQINWNKGDVDAFLDGYWNSAELTFSGTSGIARGWDAVRTRYKKNYPVRDAMGQLEFSALEFRFLGSDAALVLGHWHLTRAKGDVGGVFSLVWQRFPEGWRIIHDHTSAAEPAK
jgi:ketosteroid isomerase-like protein